jgi:hypothetical protein
VKILVEHLQSDQCENGEDGNGVEEAATDVPKAKGIDQYQHKSLISLHWHSSYRLSHVLMLLIPSYALLLDCTEYVKISVEDSGIGVPLPSRCDLFQVIHRGRLTD